MDHSGCYLFDNWSNARLRPLQKIFVAKKSKRRTRTLKETILKIIQSVSKCWLRFWDDFYIKCLPTHLIFDPVKDTFHRSKNQEHRLCVGGNFI